MKRNSFCGAALAATLCTLPVHAADVAAADQVLVEKQETVHLSVVACKGGG